jgi:hypothetical protein
MLRGPPENPKEGDRYSFIDCADTLDRQHSFSLVFKGGEWVKDDLGISGPWIENTWENIAQLPAGVPVFVVDQTGTYGVDRLQPVLGIWEKRVMDQQYTHFMHIPPLPQTPEKEGL